MELFNENFDTTKKGIFEKWVCNQERLEKMLNLKNGSGYLVDIEELRSKAERPTGCVYGLNKIFVAGQLPLRATEHGEQILIQHTKEFNEDLFATKNTLNKGLRGDTLTSYEQPSKYQTRRVQNWLKNHHVNLP